MDDFSNRKQIVYQHVVVSQISMVVDIHVLDISLDILHYLVHEDSRGDVQVRVIVVIIKVNLNKGMRFGVSIVGIINFTIWMDVFL